MQAYKNSDLYNKYVSEQATEALQTGCINNESHNKILRAYPCKLYTPNYFIRIALGLLTIVAVLFSAIVTVALIFCIEHSCDNNAVDLSCYPMLYYA